MTHIPTDRPSRSPQHGRERGAPSSPAATQKGVVLVVALVMLVVVSVIASVSMRNAGSTESSAGVVRTTELAMQAAEVALWHCEQAVTQIVEGGPPTLSTNFKPSNILPAGGAHWQSLSHWDTTSTATFVLPLALLNETGLRTTYQRGPECMVEPLPVILESEVTPSDKSAFVVTARGFGPEVAAGTGRPTGTEVWLQSHIVFE